MIQRNQQSGRFVRTHEMWTPDKWDDGYIDSDGRFRVYRPDYPRAYSEGYALRAHVVWWLTTGNIHPDGTDLDHSNEIKTDDSFENLRLLDHAAHSRRHKPKCPVAKSCIVCGKPFEIQRREYKRRRTWRFCSQECFHKNGRSKEHRKSISEGLRRAYAEGRR